MNAEVTEISKCSTPFLDWTLAQKTSDWTGRLPDPRVEWVIEPVHDHDGYRVFKYCYDIRDDQMKWVPLRGSFATISEARATVAIYLSARHSVYLDGKGEIVST